MDTAESTSESGESQVSAGALAPWDVGELPAPPNAGWKLWIGLVGPGIVLAGTSIGTGEWLFGPAVSAQYGAVLFWLALSSILFQGFCNLMFMRYAVYCGEPVNVGILRTRPGPRFWMMVFLVLEIGSIWPYNASNAAVPLASAFLGHLPQTDFDMTLVKGLGIAIFLLSFLPLVFGGTVYRMLEKIMTVKLVLVLGYLAAVALTMVSAPVIWDVATGFFRFGSLPLRPESLIVGRHFNVQIQDRDAHYKVVGTWESNGTVTGEMIVSRGSKPEKLTLRDTAKFSPDALAVRDRVFALTKPFDGTERFKLEAKHQADWLLVEGNVFDFHDWRPTRIQIKGAAGEASYASLSDVPPPHREMVDNYLRHEGLAYVGAWSYAREHGGLPPLDWATVVSFVAIAGAGGLTNMMFSNYARDKGWGMGKLVGAIPSAFGGITVGLSHTGRVFPLDVANRSRWRGWMRHILRDQAIWIMASVIGMALPCMMSLEFIRNASVAGDRVSAMSAEGITARYPGSGGIFWFLTLFCGFLVLAPGQVSVGDQIARRWTDMIWTASSRVQRSSTLRVHHVYYTILAIYFVCGLIILFTLKPVQTAKIAGVLNNIALGTVTFLSLYANRTLLPRELQPGWFHQIGVICCGLFFLGISVGFVLLL